VLRARHCGTRPASTTCATARAATACQGRDPGTREQPAPTGGPAGHARPGSRWPPRPGRRPARRPPRTPRPRCRSPRRRLCRRPRPTAAPTRARQPPRRSSPRSTAVGSRECQGRRAHELLDRTDHPGHRGRVGQLGVQVTPSEVMPPVGRVERQGNTGRVAKRHDPDPADTGGILRGSQVDMASWATERGRDAQLGSPPLSNALSDLGIHHPTAPNLGCPVLAMRSFHNVGCGAERSGAMATSSTSLTMAEQLVPDEVWSAIQPLLPPKPPRDQGAVAGGAGARQHAWVAARQLAP